MGYLVNTDKDINQLQPAGGLVAVAGCHVISGGHVISAVGGAARYRRGESRDTCNLLTTAQVPTLWPSQVSGLLLPYGRNPLRYSQNLRYSRPGAALRFALG